MATIKSYTDLSQSKTLSKILPLESADMGYLWNGASFCEYPVNNQTIFKRVENIPCWSLASLLSVLPKRIELEGVAYELSIYLNGLYYWNVNNGNLLLEVKDKDNLVDACVDMITKIHVLNLL